MICKSLYLHLVVQVDTNQIVWLDDAKSFATNGYMISC
jgi:hypothetical protein